MAEAQNKISGLTEAEARFRLLRDGPNQIVQIKKLSGLVEFLVLFKNPLVIILIGAAILSGILGDWVSASIIVVMVVASIILDFSNTYKSQKAAEELKERVRITARVIRGGREHDISLNQVVMGDFVMLAAGDLVPADGRLVAAKDFFVNEAQLTGESFPLEKPVGEAAFMGSNVVAGTAVMEVTETGRATKFSKIAQSLVQPAVLTEFDRGIKDFSFLILKVTFVLVIFIFFVNTFLKHNVLESFLFALALAVGLTPEMLPMIITINLAKGSLGLAKQGVIVKKLSAIQNFGSMDVLCTDKTGTLTEDKITLIKYIDGFGKESPEALWFAYVSSVFHTGLINPLDGAIKEHHHLDIKNCEKIDEIPFDYKRKMATIVAKKGTEKFLVSKGTPENVLGVCGKFFQGGSNKELTARDRQIFLTEFQNLSKQGFRVLAVAKKDLRDDKQTYEPDVEKDLVFLGFMAFLDPPKASVKQSLEMLERHGIEIKILTGDNELVTQKIIEEIKLPSKGVLTGPELANMNDEALRHRVENHTVFAKVSPDQKQRILRLLQKNGHVVGFMGDGINDAPSLKAADVSISVDNAVDIAKDTADLILLRKSLRMLVNGVVEGRKTFANAFKYLMMSLSSNFGNMFSMAVAAVFLPFLPMLPIQIILNNLLYDISQFTLPVDNVDDEQVAQPRKLHIAAIRKIMLVFGPVSSVFDILTFVVLYRVFQYVGPHFQTGWFLESLATQILVVFIIRTRKLPFISSRPAWQLVASCLSILAFAVFVTYNPILAGWLKFVSLPWKAFAFISAVVVTYLLSVEVAKRFFFKAQAKNI